MNDNLNDNDLELLEDDNTEDDTDDGELCKQTDKEAYNCYNYEEYDKLPDKGTEVALLDLKGCGPKLFYEIHKYSPFRNIYNIILPFYRKMSITKAKKTKTVDLFF